MKKRVLAIFLAILTFVCLLSMTAFAAEDEPIVTELVYNGRDQELVSVDVPDGYTVYYAASKKETDRPASAGGNGWKTDVPKGQDTDTYYVWYYTEDADGLVSEIASLQVTITPLALQKEDLSVTVSSCEYTGKAQKPQPRVSVGKKIPGTTLYIRSGDYEWTYANNTDAGEGTVTVKALAGGNYTFADVTVPFSIAKATLRVKANSVQLAETIRAYDPDDYTAKVAFAPGKDCALAGGVNGEQVRIKKLSGSLSNNQVGYQAVTFTFEDGDLEYIDGAKPGNYKAAVVFADQPKLQITKGEIKTGSYTAPVPKKLTADNKDHVLVEAGTAPGDSVMWYRVNSGAWVKNLNSVTGKGVGEYTVEYYIEGDTNYNDLGSTDTPIGSVTASITSPVASMISNGSIWIILAVAVIAVGTVSVLIVRKKKNAKG